MKYHADRRERTEPCPGGWDESVQSSMLAGLRLLRCKVGDVAAVLRDTLLIILIASQQHSIRRRILCKEYS